MIEQASADDMIEASERTLRELGGYSPGQYVRRNLDFVSEGRVDEVEAWFRHSVEGYRTIVVQGFPKLRKRKGSCVHHTVKLEGSIRDDAVPGSYDPYRIYYRVDGEWISNLSNRQIPTFEVIGPCPTR